MNNTLDLFVGGRICLLGEHSDWASNYMAQNPDICDGLAIASGINLGIYATVEKSDRFEITSFNALHEEISLACEMDLETLKDYAQSGNYFSYCCGVAAYLCENYQVGGIRVNITKVTLPIKKGLASSAAVCCLIANAFNKLYNLQIDTDGIMDCAYHGELLTGSHCGRLDQVCAYGDQPVLMCFSNGAVDVKKLCMNGNFYFVIADLCAKKDTRKILSQLNKAYPFPKDATEQSVHAALGTDNHQIIGNAIKALENGEPEKLGQIMTEAQQLFDAKVAPLCPDELTAPVLHSVLNDPKIQPLIYGAKGVGSQGDGTVQLLVKTEAAQKELVDYLNTQRKLSAFPFTLKPTKQVRKAIIPVAGLGTRMFPETHFVKKAFLPIIGQDGTVIPVIVKLLQELDEAQIEEIALIISKGELEEYEQLFHFDYSEEYAAKLPHHLRSAYSELHRLGKKVQFIIQHEPKGFGHAVYQAKAFTNEEPVLLLLGDFIYTSNISMNCARQTIEAYTSSGGKSVISVKPVPFADAKHYGIVHGTFSPEQDHLMLVDTMVEKPEPKQAEKDLAVNGLCYATFGQYVLTKEVFDCLAEEISYAEERCKGVGGHWAEINLTAALENSARKGRLVGIPVDGTSHDVGIPEKYYETFVQFGREVFPTGSQ